jgi:hypothetical protein
MMGRFNVQEGQVGVQEENLNRAMNEAIELG